MERIPGLVEMPMMGIGQKANKMDRLRKPSPIAMFRKDNGKMEISQILNAYLLPNDGPKIL